MAELSGMLLGGLLFIACFREIVFSKDVSRMSWVKAGVVTIPSVFVFRSIGDAENGAIEFSYAIVQTGLVGLLTAIFFLWAKVRDDIPYKRSAKKLPKILAWVWITLMAVALAL